MDRRRQNVVYPRAWNAQVGMIRYMTVVMVVFAALALMIWFADGGILWFVLSAAMAIFLAFPFALSAWKGADGSGSSRQALRTGRSGLVNAIPRSRALALLAVNAVGVLFILYLALNRKGLRMRYEDDDGVRWSELMSRFVLEISPLLVVFFICFFFLFLLGKRKTLGVGMDAEGVYHWWWGGCSFYPWERLVGVRLMRPQAGPRVELVASDLVAEANPEENWLGRMVWMRQRQRKIQLALFRVHPGIVYQALCFYIRNPERRDELGDERALERMRSGDYGEIIDEIRRYGRALNPGESAPK